MFILRCQALCHYLLGGQYPGVPNDKLFKFERFVAQMIPGHSQRHLRLIFNYRGKKTAALQNQLAMD